MKEKPSNGGTPSDGTSDNQVPHNNNGGGPGSISLTEEEKTITIDDSTELLSRGKGESTAAALEDITTDSVLTVVMEGDTVTSVTISSFGGGDRQEKNKNDSSAETNDNSDTESSTDSNKGSPYFTRDPLFT